MMPGKQTAAAIGQSDWMESSGGEDTVSSLQKIYTAPVWMRS